MMEYSESYPGRRVLVVDDSEQITALVADVLRATGAELSTANTGHDAMVRLQVEDFDLVLLDLVMPSPDGWDVLRFMRQIKPHLLARTILLTGDRYHKQTIRLIDDTELSVIYKPFDLNDLRATARSVLGQTESMPAA